MAGFATDATHVSSSGTALAWTGVAHAIANATNLVAPATGVALAKTPGSTMGNVGTVPQAEINTLADILAACVGSAGSSSAACSALFGNALSGGTTGTRPSDTATAAINMAHNPAANVAGLYGLAGAASPFAPGLSVAPNDWTISLNFTAGGMTGSSQTTTTPVAIAIDASGNAWVTNSWGYGDVAELSSLGVARSGSKGYSPSAALWHPVGIAIDRSGNAWTSSGGAVFGLSSTGTFLNAPLGYAAGASGSSWVSIDGSGDLWIPDSSVRCRYYDKL